MRERYVGLISGTSIDGIDAVVCTLSDGRFERVEAALNHPYPAALQQRLIEVSLAQPPLSFREYCALDAAIGTAFADATQALLLQAAIDPRSIRAIGSHGQTLFHDGPAGLTLQLGDANRIAAATGLTTVADFRRADLARGGQGAPLLPVFHHARFASPDEVRAVLNLGGIANLTLLPGLDAATVRGFDTGPANGLMNEWAERHLGQRFDPRGQLAAQGQADEAVLAALLADPYFSRPPPKSTGRDVFHLDWARRRSGLDRLDAADGQATLCELTARSVATALRAAQPQTRRVLVCGGGAHNDELMRRLRVALDGMVVETTDVHGLDGDWVEAAAFAWLASQALRGESGNLPGVTGARSAAILGGIYRAL